MQFHIWQILLGIDQLLNTILGGWSDETFSARCYRLRSNRKWYIAMIVVNTIFFWQKHHCQESYGSELNRLQVPEEYRK